MGRPVSPLPPPLRKLEAVYQRLLAGDPTAPNEFAELVLEPLLAQLQQRHPSLPDPQLLQEAVTDSLLAFLQRPERYRSERGGLWHYLVMNAEGDLRNALNRQRREQRLTLPLSSVAPVPSRGNSSMEEEAWRQAEARLTLSTRKRQELLKRLSTERFSPAEWPILLLMLQGERRTRVYAEKLGLAHLPLEEQRKQVKRVKDRLRLRLKRYGARFNQ
ncbi:hypothetical protein [Thermogemmatispora sp.]|uniref:hypothetical protein n=1 Tax=Thermogemmatispora sp. TaxID=1968838 RepID=UPI0035E4237F